MTHRDHLERGIVEDPVEQRAVVRADDAEYVLDAFGFQRLRHRDHTGRKIHADQLRVRAAFGGRRIIPVCDQDLRMMPGAGENLIDRRVNEIVFEHELTRGEELAIAPDRLRCGSFRIR